MIYRILLTIYFCIISSISAFALEGYVVDGDGNGVAGAKVAMLFNDPSFISIGSATKYIFSSPDGYFKSIELPNNISAEVTVSRSGFTTATKLVNTSTKTVQRFDLNKSLFNLSGRVLDMNGNTLSNIAIDGGKLGTRYTTAAGEFSFTAAYGTKYTISASKEDSFFGEPRTGRLEGNTERVFIEQPN